MATFIRFFGYNFIVLRVEFHPYTLYSKDSLTTPRQLISACRRKGIDRVVVTDHNTIAGQRRVRC